MKKSLNILLAASIMSSSAFADETNILGQMLGSPINNELPKKDISLEFPSNDGTLVFAYIPSAPEKLKISFSNHTVYVTAISKKVAIIEASRVENSITDCQSSLRFFRTNYINKRFKRFLSIEQLKEKGFIRSNQEDISAVETRFDPVLNHTLQYGCIKSAIDPEKHAFIISFSDNSLKEVASQERDELNATSEAITISPLKQK